MDFDSLADVVDSPGYLATFYRKARMTPNRQKVADCMYLDEEGLGPRAFSVLIQLADGQEITPNDAEWITDEMNNPALATVVDGKPQLAEFGRTLMDAADRADLDTIYRLTTRPDW